MVVSRTRVTAPRPAVTGQCAAELGAQRTCEHLRGRGGQLYASVAATDHHHLRQPRLVQLQLLKPRLGLQKVERPSVTPTTQLPCLAPQR